MDNRPPTSDSPLARERSESKEGAGGEGLPRGHEHPLPSVPVSAISAAGTDLSPPLPGLRVACVRIPSMLFYLNDLAENPAAFAVYLAAFAVAILTGLSFHEFTHAWAANELGDDTAARRGRLTLNPLAHLDPLGTALILLIGFGMAKRSEEHTSELQSR